MKSWLATGSSRRWALALAAALAVTACLPGGGTEDTNDFHVSGRLVGEDGNPSSGALVTLYPKGLAIMPEPESTLTDRHGYFVFRHVAPGEYSLQGRLRTGSGMVFLPSLDVSSGALLLPPLILEPAASLRGSLTGASWAGGRARLAGTPFQAAVDSAGRFDFPALAPGRYDLRVYAHAFGGPEREVARREAVLEADQSLELPPASTELALGWARRARLDMETSDAGPGIVTDFPLLVRLAGTGFPRDAQGGGKDIRFAKPDGTLLPHEIERWDSLSGRAEIWVRMDTVRSDTGVPALWMYWGNPTAADASSGVSVYDAASGFAGVWHLGQDSAGAPSRIRDASTALNQGVLQGTGSQATSEAAVGLGLAFNGTDQFVSTSNLHSDPDVFTLSLWFRASVAGGKLAGFESSDVGRGKFYDRHLWLDNAGRLCFGIFSPAPAVITAADSPFVKLGVVLPGENPDLPDIERILVSQGAYVDGSWHQVTAMLSPEGQFLYVDGALAAADARATDGGAYDGYWRFGGGTLGTWVGRSDKDFFQGSLDEASVALRARSAAWIRLAYLTQAPGAARLRVESEY